VDTLEQEVRFLPREIAGVTSAGNVDHQSSGGGKLEDSFAGLVVEA
jgi:hypothetical protein